MKKRYKKNKSAQKFLDFAQKFKNHQNFSSTFLEYFCQNCWSFEKEQDLCLSLFENYCQNLSLQGKLTAIPQLIEMSKNFPKLIFVAFELFETLETSDKEKIKVPLIGWTHDDRYTYISDNELEYRKRHKLPFDYHNNFPTRPSDITDFECYYKFLSMCHASKTEIDLFLSGW